MSCARCSRKMCRKNSLSLFKKDVSQKFRTRTTVVLTKIVRPSVRFTIVISWTGPWLLVPSGGLDLSSAASHGMHMIRFQRTFRPYPLHLPSIAFCRF